MQTGTMIKARLIVESQATKYKPHTIKKIVFPIEANGEKYNRPQYVFQQLMFWFIKNYAPNGLTQLDAVLMALKYDRQEGLKVLQNNLEVEKQWLGNKLPVQKILEPNQ